MKQTKLQELQALCAEHYLEYTIDGGSKSPTLFVEIWSSRNSKLHIYGVAVTLDLAIEIVLKQLNKTLAFAE